MNITIINTECIKTGQHFPYTLEKKFHWKINDNNNHPNKESTMQIFLDVLSMLNYTFSKIMEVSL